jgi:drug/metabolite transporter (DMT)-like permease
MPHAFRVHAALTVVALLFSSNYIISKLAMNAFAPMSFAYLRVLGSALVLNVLLRERKPVPLSRGDAWRIVGYAVLGVVINQTLFLSGLSLTSAHVAAILMTAIPVFALGIAIVMKEERGTTRKVGGIALAAAGALLVVGGEGFRGATRSLIGDLLLVGNGFSYALYLVLSKPAMARISPRRVIGRMFAIGAALLFPLSAWSLLHESWMQIPARAWIALLLVIAGPTVAAYLLNAWALAHTDSSLVATYTYLQPVITVFLAALFLHEHIRPVALAGGAMIFGGVYASGRPAPPAAREEAVPGGPD